MDSELARNQVIRLDDPRRGRGILLRLVNYFREIVCWGVIEIESRKARPYLLSHAELTDRLDAGNAVRVKEPVLHKLREPHTDSEQARYEELRDLVEALTSTDDDLLKFFNCHSRARILELITSDQKYAALGNRFTALGHFRKYFEYGMYPLSLVPDYSLRGGKSPPDKPNERARRKKHSSRAIGRPRIYGSLPTFNIDHSDRANIDEALEERYYTTTTGSNSMMDAYHSMIYGAYCDHFNFIQGKAEPVVKSTVPSETQFRTRAAEYDRERGFERGQKDRLGPHRYLLEGRPLYGRAADITKHRCVMQIDAAHIPLELLSDADHKTNVGTATLYIVVDTEFAEITGLSLVLGSPNYMGVMLAIQSSLTNKVQFCAEHGIEITDDMWYAQHQADAYLTDLGAELTSDNMRSSMERSGSTLYHVGRARGDLKGIVEGMVRSLKHPLDGLPGAPGKDDDYRAKKAEQDAVLTPSRLMRTFIRMAIAINHSSWRARVRAPREMVLAGVPLIPERMWRWSLGSRVGALRRVDEDLASRWFRFTVRASVTPRGIVFPGLGIHYTCAKAEAEDWAARARKKRWKVTLVYDPRNLTTTHLYNEETGEFTECYLLDEMVTGWTLKEAEDYVKARKDSKANTALIRAFRKGRLLAERDEEFQAAAEDKQASSAEPSVAPLTERRSEEQRRIDHEQAGTEPSPIPRTTMVIADPDPLTAAQRELKRRIKESRKGAQPQ